MIRLILMLIIFPYFGTIDSYAQNTSQLKRPEKGQLMPDFVFSDIDGQPGKSIKLSDFRGQHVILDFWTLGCAGCIGSFPKMDSLDRAEKSKLKVILVGINRSSKKEIKPAYAKYKKAYGLQVLAVFDTIAAKTMEVQGVPAIVWVDDYGKFKGLSSSLGTSENIKNYLSNTSDIIDRGRSSYMSAEPNWLKVSYDPAQLLGINANGVYKENDFEFRSVLYKWREGMPAITGGFVDLLDGRYYENPNIKSFKVELLGVDLRYLYNVASMGRNWFTEWEDYYPEFLYDVKDKEKVSRLFTSSSQDVENMANNLWSYSLVVPYRLSKDASVVRGIMLQDLERYFGYTVIEQKLLMDCWVLKRDSSIKDIKNSFEYQQGRKQEYTIGLETGRIAIKGHPIKELLYRLETNRIKFDRRNRFRNGTGLPDDFLIDIELNLKAGKTSSIDEANQELAKYGLRLVWEKMPLKVLTVKDVK